MQPFITLKKSYEEKIISDEYRASSVIPVIAFEEEARLFLCEARGKKYLGFGFHCSPLYGADGKIEEQVNALLNDYYPPNTMMQIVLFRSPDINMEVAKMKSIRESMDNPLLRDIIHERGDFLKKYANESMVVNNSNGMYELGYIHDLQIYITVKIPLKGSLTDEEIQDVGSIKTKVKTTLENIMLRPKAMTASSWIRLMGTIINWNDKSSWSMEAAEWDKTEPLCKQVFDYDNDVEISRSHIRLGKKYLKILSPKRRPSQITFGEALYACGDIFGGFTGVKKHYFVATSIYFPDTDSTKQNLERKRQFAINQSSGPMVKFVPQLLDVKGDFDILYESIQEGKKPIRLAYHVGVFADSKEDAESASIAIRNFWRGNRFELMEDNSIMFPIFLNCLPLCSDADAVTDLMRHKTLTCREAVPFLPLFGEWKGTGTPHVNLISRNGQLMTLSLHDTSTNKNATIAATSGAGKSFLTNELIASYMSEGAQVWVIDVGYSYKKLCEILKGDFIQFGGGKQACLNPFPLVVSLDGTKETSPPDIDLDIEINDEDAEEDALIGLICAMAAPTEKLSDLQVATLKKILHQVWMEHYRETTVTHIANKCLEHEDPRIKDIGNQLYAFTEQGSYSRYFNGNNNISFKNQLTVLELEELKGRKHLQQVVLLQLIYQIQQEIYLGDRNRKKVVIIDEAWDLLNQGDVAKFIETGYRRFRKYGGSIVVVTQSMNDLYNSPTGIAIAENTATNIVLKQKAETIVQLKESGRFAVPEYVYDMLKTVHTQAGVYSEMFINSEYGHGIGRLVVNDFQKLLYSTDARDVYAIEQFIKQGMSTEEAIKAVLNSRSRNNRVA